MSREHTGEHRAASLLVAAILACGCANLGTVVEALSHDTATVCLEITTALGTTIRLARTNLPSGLVTCSARAGLRVRADPPIVDERD